MYDACMYDACMYAACMYYLWCLILMHVHRMQVRMRHVYMKYVCVMHLKNGTDGRTNERTNRQLNSRTRMNRKIRIWIKQIYCYKLANKYCRELANKYAYESIKHKYEIGKYIVGSWPTNMHMNQTNTNMNHANILQGAGQQLFISIKQIQYESDKYKYKLSKYVAGSWPTNIHESNKYNMNQTNTICFKQIKIWNRKIYCRELANKPWRRVVPRLSALLSPWNCGHKSA